LSIRPETFGPKDVRFLLGASEERFRRSLAASLGSHIVVFSILLFLISLAPERVYELITPNREQYSIVWLPEEGPGGGGGGGGNESLEPPRQVELQGVDETELSVPVQEEPDFIEPEVEPEVIEAQAMNIPAVSMAAAAQTTSGVLEWLSASASASQGSGRGGGAGTGEGTGIGPGSGPGLGPGEGGGVGGGVYRPGAGVVIPQLRREVKPQYTSEALRAKVTGTVHLECVVLPDGTVGDVKVIRSLDPVFGLDEEAVKAAKQWLFEPGTRFGEPVPVLVVLALDFNLR
jgi:TonB family protein